MTHTPTPTGRRPRWALITLASAAVVATISVGTYIYAASKTTPTAQAAAGEAPPSITVHGVLQLHDLGPKWQTGAPCHALSAGYADITAGADVTVYDRAGKIVGLGKLDPGVVATHPTLGDAARVCDFRFRVADVPKGLGFYAVEISHRGKQQYTETELGQPLALKLG